MDLKILQLLVDFGLVVLIWLVQLCIYPAFIYYNNQNLLRWHNSYTPKITVIVLPLMLTQLFLSIYFLYNQKDFYSLTNSILVVLTWLSTFLIYVPLHQKITLNKNAHLNSKKLIQYNWLRVFAWNLIFLLNLINYLINS